MDKKFILPAIKEGSQHIIKSDIEKEIISLSLISGLGFIFFGPGGHAKSALIKAVKDTIKGCSFNVKSVSSGTRVDEMKGGIDLRAMEEDKVIKYDYQYSPLNANILCLEEMFDMPNTVGASFKDWITEKAFRDGNEYFKLPLSLVCGVTNREPNEVASAGDWIEALIQRFPLQHRSAWDTYSAADYLDLFNAPEQIDSTIYWCDIVNMQIAAKQMEVSPQIKGILAELLAKASGISPRTAMYALQIAKAAAVIDNCSSVKKEHLVVLKYLPGLSELGKSIASEISLASARAEGESALQELDKAIDDINNSVRDEKSPIKLLQAVKKIDVIIDKLSILKVPDTLTTQRNILRETSSSIRGKISQRAIFNVSI